MILVTGGTGFIGSRVVEQLIQSREEIRILLRPHRKTPNLPRKMALDIAVSSMEDERGLRAALRNVDTVFHFATAEHQGQDADLESVDVRGTQSLLNAAREAEVKRILFLGRVGADKSSSYPVLRAKALAEDEVRKSGIPFCILKLTDVFGANDHFTLEIASAIRHAPLVLPYPGGGKAIVQPLWIEDLLSVMMLIQEIKRFNNGVYEIGGGEFFEFTRIARTVMQLINKKKLLFQVSPAYLRIINLWFKSYKGSFPLSTRWLDLLAIDRTCPLDSLPRNFSILPGRFQSHLEYLAH
ncbi:MAG: NAD-dependent epimerase/dehydratase family protein [Anaerolineaceae bacterium]|nr:NAD-dependent epimerase/dehydratase family protein [Anaerolineaceae bacterium]